MKIKSIGGIWVYHFLFVYILDVYLSKVGHGFVKDSYRNIRSFWGYLEVFPKGCFLGLRGVELCLEFFGFLGGRGRGKMLGVLNILGNLSVCLKLLKVLFEALIELVGPLGIR